ncbi:MAG: tripartite tricarboxylate transporter TctB family protein [Actinomycetota bacterium]|nr:tripartite tricarboxylate transporter TctB family protein [Actinomycetota bacterium]
MILNRVRGAVLAELVVVVLGAVAVTIAFGYGLTVEGEIGPGFLPVMAGGVMALAAGFDAVRNLGRPTTEDDTVEKTVDPDVDIHGRDAATRRRQLWMVIGLVVATVALVGALGFLLAFALLVVACAVLVEHRRLIPSLVTAALVAAGVWLVFVLGLGIPLPTGFFAVR